MSPGKAAREQAEALYNAIQATKLMAPQSNVLSPIGEELLVEGLKKQVTRISTPRRRGAPPSIAGTLSLSRRPSPTAAADARR